MQFEDLLDQQQISVLPISTPSNHNVLIEMDDRDVITPRR